MATVKFDKTRKQWAVDAFAADVLFFSSKDEADSFADFLNTD